MTLQCLLALGPLPWPLARPLGLDMTVLVSHNSIVKALGPAPGPGSLPWPLAQPLGLDTFVILSHDVLYYEGPWHWASAPPL